MSIHLARPRRALRLRYKSLGPANSTLGFGNIYVVSTPTSARREPLLHAANITELDLTIPLQPEWTEEDQRKFRLKENSTLGRGSLLAWLGHLHALREFMASGAETALLLEDDVDWDIRLRTRQIPLVQRAVRYLTTPPGGDTDSDGDAAHRYPYGNPSRWDLLYLGHCGDYFHGMDIGFNRGHVKPKDLAELPHASFRDSTMLGWDNLHPWTTSLLQNLGVPEKTRLVHRSRFPLCTFAYAVTRASAHRLLTELAATEPNREGSHAYDVMILRACISDGLRCLSVNPELFHHIMGKSMIAGVEKNDNLPPVDAKGYNQVLLRNETTNIGCGYWSGAFNFKDDDVNRLAWLREEVGRKGRCLKPGRDLPG
ncbi:hypothetical protein GQ53DRAFT_800279 [Thozetella sp. PMI_491]|nr:hypothetical protein GQ53DRAFT_800279 [Thozetella sp. PMI_491]